MRVNGKRGTRLKEDPPGEEPSVSGRISGSEWHGEQEPQEAGGLVGSGHAEGEGREGVRPGSGDFPLHLDSMRALNEHGGEWAAGPGTRARAQGEGAGTGKQALVRERAGPVSMEESKARGPPEHEGSIRSPRWELSTAPRKHHLGLENRYCRGESRPC